MNKYQKICNIYHRDHQTHRLVEGDYSRSFLWALKDLTWEWTEKVDGTNIRLIYDGNSVEIRGKSDNANLHPQLITSIQEMVDVEQFKYTFGEKPVCVYGEGYGAGIQKGGKYRDDKSFVAFDLKIGDQWAYRALSAWNTEVMLGLPSVPIVGRGTLEQAVEYVKSRPKSAWGDFVAEGIVCHPPVELFDVYGERVIVKIKDRDFVGAK